MGVWSATIWKNSENNNLSAPLRWSEVDECNIWCCRTDCGTWDKGLHQTRWPSPIKKTSPPPITGVECSFSLLPTSIVNVRPNLQMMPLLITLIFPRAQQTSPVYSFSTGISFFTSFHFFFYLILLPFSGKEHFHFQREHLNLTFRDTLLTAWKKLCFKGFHSGP